MKRWAVAAALLVPACKKVHREEPAPAPIATTASADAEAETVTARDAASEIASTRDGGGEGVTVNKEQVLAILGPAKPPQKSPFDDARDPGADLNVVIAKGPAPVLGTSGKPPGTVAAPGEQLPPADITVKILDVTGAIERGVATRVVMVRKGALKACYQRELKREPTLAGRVIVSIDVGPNGRARAITIEQTFHDPLAACLKGLARGFVFPATTDGFVIRFSIDVKPR